MKNRKLARKESLTEPAKLSWSVQESSLQEQNKKKKITSFHKNPVRYKLRMVVALKRKQNKTSGKMLFIEMIKAYKNLRDKKNGHR